MLVLTWSGLIRCYFITNSSCLCAY